MYPKELIRVDQVLHGYDRGHRDVAGSAKLDEGSRATMLVLSDLLTASDLGHDDSYLTGYPLRNAGRYVLARTWGAGPKYRPGSVWTHSLVFDYAALTQISDLTALNSLFREPTKHSLDFFRLPLEISPRIEGTTDVECGPRAAMALVQMYGETPVQHIMLPSVSSETDEALALGLWRQMWPALRRDFAFMTGGGEFPIELESECSLCFSKQAFVPPTFRKKDSLDIGYQYLLDDLRHVGPTPLRSFLSRYIIESKTPRKLAVRLAQLQNDKSNFDFQSKIEAIQKLTGQEPLPRLFKETLVEELNTTSVAKELIKFIEILKDELIDIDLKSIAERFEGLTDLDLSYLLHATQPAKSGSFGEQLFQELALKFPIGKLAAAADDETRVALVRFRSEISVEPNFWPSGDDERAELVDQIRPWSALDLDSGLPLFGKSIGERTLRSLLHNTAGIHSPESIELLKSENNNVRYTFLEWLSSRPHYLPVLLEKVSLLEPDIIESLAWLQVKTRYPMVDQIIWRDALLKLGAEDMGSLQNATLVIGYVCALALPVQDALDVAMIVFDRLQRSARNMKLRPAEEKYLLDAIAPSGRSWSVSSSLTRSVVAQWPVDQHTLGALLVTQDRQYLTEIVGEIIAQQGSRQLSGLLKSPTLPAQIRDCISDVLKPAQKNSLLFWWT